MECNEQPRIYDITKRIVQQNNAGKRKDFGSCNLSYTPGTTDYVSQRKAIVGARIDGSQNSNNQNNSPAFGHSSFQCDTGSSDSCFESQTDNCSRVSRNQSNAEASVETEEDLPNERVKLNISGTFFEATLKTLRRFANTPLANLAQRCSADRQQLNQVHFFERNPAAFADILEFYRSGELHLDQGKCGAVFKQELEFWGLKKSSISCCCWSRYDTHRSTVKMYEELDNLFDDGAKSAKPAMENGCQSRMRFYIFQMLENPSFSLASRIFSIVSMVITLLSIFTFVAETHHIFQQIKLSNGTLLPAPAPAEPASSGCCCGNVVGHVTNHSADDAVNITHDETVLEHSLHDENHIDSHEIFHYLDFFTFSYFVLEIFIRFTFAYNKRLFCKSAMNIVEVICICAHFISLVEHSISVDGQKDKGHDLSVTLLFVLRSLRIMRVARIFKLFRHMTGFKVLVYTIVVSVYELLLIISFLFAGVLIFASIIHYAEENTFPNIPFAIWWALVTMTTVGYGDITPKSNLGYFIGAMCVVAGILVIAFTVPVVVNNFTLYYAACKSRQARLKMMQLGEETEEVATKWKNRVLHKPKEVVLTRPATARF